jgi:hypothetical protein
VASNGRQLELVERVTSDDCMSEGAGVMLCNPELVLADRSYAGEW